QGAGPRARTGLRAFRTRRHAVHEGCSRMTQDGAKRLPLRAAVVDYDLGNLPSVTKALQRIGVDTVITDSGDGFANADAVVLPGVGHFGAGARNLRDRGLDGPLKEWAAAG